MVVSTKTPATATREPGPSQDCFDRLRNQVQQRLQQFHTQPVTPLAARELERDLKVLLDETGRTLLQEAFQRLEPTDKQQAAAKIRYRRATYRINKKTRAAIATSFGVIKVWSFLYLHQEPGEPGLHPLHVLLGIEAGTTTVLAERVGAVGRGLQPKCGAAVAVVRARPALVQ